MVGSVYLSDDLCEHWYPCAESNRNLQNRNLKFYPLNYGGRYYKYSHFIGDILRFAQDDM